MVDTQCNSAKTVAPAAELTVRSRGRGRGRSRSRGKGRGKATPVRGLARAMTEPREEASIIPQDHVEKEVEVKVEEEDEPEVATQVGGTNLPSMSTEVVQQMLAFLSELTGIRAIPRVSTLHAPYT